jgi:uroporphyrinogen III methyltransferase/synthase
MSHSKLQHPATLPQAVEASPAGRVWFVGAGPGAADLLTLRAARLLESADVVLYDVLVPPHLLGILRPEVEKIPVCRNDPTTGNRFGDPGLAVGDLLVRLAGMGRRVVRLKGGDPLVFARFSEEVAPLEKAGIAYEVVPGVTAATAAAAALTAPLTSRACASSVTLITGHRAGPAPQNHEASPADADFSQFALLPGTLVVYMGLEQLDRWTQSLLDAGCPGDRPVAVVSRCGWPDERRFVTTLAALRQNTTVRAWPSPAVTILGDVVGAAPGVGLLQIPAGEATRTRPLAGRHVLITRPASHAHSVLERLHHLGAHGHCLPVIEIVPPASWERLDCAIREAATYDWIVFSSANGVEAFARRLTTIGDARLLGTARLAAVGPRTAEALTGQRLACDLVPATHSAAGLLADLADEPPGRRFLLIQADRGRDTLQQGLTASGHTVDRVTAYVSRDIFKLDPLAEKTVNSGLIDWVMFSSPAITSSAIRLFGGHIAGWKTACNSQAAADILRAAGLPVHVVSPTPSMDSLLDAMAAWEEHAAEQGK